MDAMRLRAFVVVLALAGATSTIAAPTPGTGWGQINRDIQIGNLWDQVTNRHYGGVNNALQWPGGWWNNHDGPLGERRTMANYKGFLIGARNVPDPQYPTVIWPYMVGQRDGYNDGELGEAIRATPPDPLATNLLGAAMTQILFKGRLVRRTFRQANAVVTVDGVTNARLNHILSDGVWPPTTELAGNEDNTPYQADVIDPTIPADLMLETYSWSRMGIATNRMIYAFVDRENDDYHIWHWRMINDGIWGRLGIDRVDCCGGTWGTVQGVMHSLMFHWYRGSRGSILTYDVPGQGSSTGVWRYYGTDYDGARTEDMRLVYVIDGDQSTTRFPAYANQVNHSTDDIGDPDPLTGELLSAKTAGWQILHYDVSPTDRHDDPAQPTTLGWTNINLLLRTGIDGHEAKYRQMRYGYQGTGTTPIPTAMGGQWYRPTRADSIGAGRYYPGYVQETPGRGRHPFADDGASWIKASNDPATSGDLWPGKVLGFDIEVTDVEQQAGFGPDDMAPGDTINGIHVVGVKGLDVPYAQQVGRRWLMGEITDAAKDSVVHGTIDSLFAVMRQAKSVYESVSFGDRYASTRQELEQALRAAAVQGKLTLSPPAPATFAVEGAAGGTRLSWTLNTLTGSNIAGWRLYRAVGNFWGDSAWTLIHEAPANELSYFDDFCAPGSGWYYYLTTFDAQGHESTMFTRTDRPTGEFGAICPTAIFESASVVRFSLSQNAPNPFNPLTVIRLSVATSGPIRLDVYNTTGQIVRTLVDRPLAAGNHEVAWDGKDNRGRRVASGTYVYRLESGGNVRVRRMTLVR